MNISTRPVYCILYFDSLLIVFEFWRSFFASELFSLSSRLFCCQLVGQFTSKQRWFEGKLVPFRFEMDPVPWFVLSRKVENWVTEWLNESSCGPGELWWAPQSIELGIYKPLEETHDSVHEGYCISYEKGTVDSLNLSWRGFLLPRQ